MSDYEILDMKENILAIPTSEELIRHCWETSTKNGYANSFMAGMLDALRWSCNITPEQYSRLYDEMV